MNQAKTESEYDHLTGDGLEEFFLESEAVSQPSESPLAAPARGMTFKEACIFFGLKPTALRVRIKSGDIAAEKIDGLNGPEWRIYPTQPSRNSSVSPSAPTRGPEPDKLLMMMQDLQIRLDAANAQLQAANFRNGYLEAQLEGRDREILLLTDNQHRRHRWSRFWSWFTGTSV